MLCSDTVNAECRNMCGGHDMISDVHGIKPYTTILNRP